MNDMVPNGHGRRLSPSTVPATAAQDPVLTPLPPPAKAALDLLLTPVVGIPEGKTRQSLTEAEREQALVLAPPDLTALPAEARSAAATRADELERLLVKPMNQQAMRLWLGVINGASRNPQDADEFSARVMSFTEALDDLPAAALTTEARRKVIAASGGFFPGAYDVRKVIEPIVAAWRNEAALLRRIAQAAPPGTPQLAAPGEDQDPPLTDADLDRRFALWQAGPVVGIIAAQVRATRRHLQQRQPDLAARFASRFADLLHEKPAAPREPAPPAAPKDRPKVKPLPVGLEQRIAASRARLASGTLSAGETALEQMRLAAMEAALRRQQGAADPETA